MTTEENKISSQEAEQEARDLAEERALLAPEREEPLVMMLPVGSLERDPMIQRHLSADRVNVIASKYNPDAIGVLTASRRDDGKYYVLDGQHRQAAMELLGKGHEEVQVKVFRDLSSGDEAALFRLLNNTKRPQPADLFRVKLIERDPVALAMFKLLTKYEWRIRGGIKDGNFLAIRTLERLFEIDPDLAETAVNLLCGAWGNRVGTLNDGLLAGMGRLLLRRGDIIDGAHMIKRLARVKNGPREVINRAETMREAMKMTRPSAVAMILVDIYNEDLRSRKLDPWTEK